MPLDRIVPPVTSQKSEGIMVDSSNSEVRIETAIVVPCYNEERRLSVDKFVQFLRTDSFVYFVFVNDGSTDCTLAMLRQLEQAWPERVHVLDQQPNRGKGEAVRRGVLWALRSARFEYVGYFDADLATPLESIAELADILNTLPEIAVVMGARIALLGRNIERKPLRHLAGRLFATAASLTLELAVYDTQTGAKLFRCLPEVCQAFEEPFCSRWTFDLELLARYLHNPLSRGAKGLYELPLKRWTDVADSKVRPIDFLRAFGDMLQIYRRYPLRRRWNNQIWPLTEPFIRYVMVGGLGTLIHYATLTSLVELLAVSATWAAGIGATVGAVVNYFFNYHFTFTSQASHRSTLPKFMVVAVAGVWLSSIGVNGGVRIGVHYLLAQFSCTLLVLLLGYVLNRCWTFRESANYQGNVGDSLLPPKATASRELGGCESGLHSSGGPGDAPLA